MNCVGKQYNKIPECLDCKIKGSCRSLMSGKRKGHVIEELR